MGDEDDKAKVKLTHMYMFNANLNPREGQEEEKIVWYHPTSTEINLQVTNIGLVEAVVNFSSTFSDEPAHSLHTQKSRTVFRELEPGYWLCLCVSIPYSRKQTDGGEVLEFRPEEVNDEVLLGVLERAHQMFSLFHGGIQKVVNEGLGDMDSLRQKVSHFYSRYLCTLRIELTDVMDIWGGVQYLPLDPAPFLRVQSLVNRVEESFPSVQSTLYLQQGQLVWSGVPPHPTKLLVHYLSTSLLPGAKEKRPMSPLVSPAGPHGRFLVGGTDTPLPVVHVGEDKYHLVVYHAINSTLCLLLQSQPEASIYARLHELIGPLLANLSADLTHIWTKKVSGAGSTAPDNVQFLYFNAANMAVKSTVQGQGQQQGDGGDMVRLAGDLLADLGHLSKEKGGEVTVKLATDQWIVARMAGERTVLVLLMQKNLNLMEVAEEVGRLYKTCFDNICMM